MALFDPEPNAAARRVLVVDDEPMICAAMTRMLRPFEVIAAGHVDEAMDLCARGSFDAILCDFSMPEKDGEAFYQELSQQRPELLKRLVFLTGGAQTKQAQGFLDSIENPCLMKPVPRQNLVNMLHCVFAGREAERD